MLCMQCIMMVYRLSEYTSIRIRKETKKLLEKTLIEFEARLGRRLDYDELIRILAIQTQANPQLLRVLIQNPVKSHDTDKAQRLLRRERMGDTRFRITGNPYML